MSLALAASLAAPWLLGCGAESDTRTIIDFWAMGAEGERVRPLIATFERANPDVRIRLQQIPWSAAHEKLLTAFAGDSLPDVCQLGNTWLAEFTALDALVDLTDRVERSPTIGPDDFFTGVWQGNVIDQRVVGIPWYVDTRLIFYRTDLLAAAGYDKPPARWSDWMKMLRVVQAQQSGRGGDRYAILLPTNEFEQPIILGMQAGADLLRDNGQYGDFSGPEFRRAFEFYVNIFREGLAPTLPNTRISNVSQEFERGTFALYVTGPWNVIEFRNRMSPAMRGRWTTSAWPSPSGDGPGVSTAGGSSLVVFGQSPRQDAAWRFVEFLSSVDQQVEMCLCTSNLPARRDAWDRSGLLDDPEYVAFHEQLKNVRPAPPVPEWEQIVNGELAKTAELVITDSVTIDVGLEQLDRRVDEILEKRRWMLAREPAAALQ